MLPNTSLASELAKARELEYSFCRFFIALKIKKSTKVIMGVSKMITVVSFQLMIHRKIKLPRNCRKLRSRMDTLSEEVECTVAMSLVSREIS